MHAVIFDIDDTLLHSMSDDDRLYRQAIRDTLGEVRFRDSLNDYEHVSDSGILRQVLADNAIDDREQAFNTIRERFLASLHDHVAQQGPFEEVHGARALIARLRSSNQHAVALATGCWRPSAELKLRTAGFEYGGLPLASADLADARTDIMRHALDALGPGITRITYYGDGEWDRRACAALDWEFRAVGKALNGIETFANEFN